MLTRPGKRDPLGNTKNASIASATALSTLAAATTPSSAAAVYAQIQAVGGPLYFVTDGATPSDSSYGRTLAEGETYDVTEQNTDWDDFIMIGTSVSILFSA